MSDRAVSNSQAQESRRQREQSELVEQSERLAGVADAMAAYRKFAPYVPTTSTDRPQPVVYSTGGNA